MIGIHNYTNVIFLKTIEEVLELKSQYTFIGADNIPGAVPLQEHIWEKDSLMIFVFGRSWNDTSNAKLL